MNKYYSKIVYYWTILLFQSSWALISSETSPNNRAPYGITTDYWTAFINVTFVDTKNSIKHTESTETGRYSTDIVRAVRGIAVELKGIGENRTEEDKLSGCEPPFDTTRIPDSEKWIAVIKRGGCPFNRKISNAISLNASAVIVYDNVPKSNSLESMKVSSQNIPSIFTFNWKGKELLQYMEMIDKVYISLQKGSHCRSSPSGLGREINVTGSFIYCTQPETWDEFHQILQKQNPFWSSLNNLTLSPQNAFHIEKRYSVMFVSISFIILMIISMAWLIFYYVQRFRYMHAKDRLERRLCTQAKRALARITTSVLKKGDIMVDSAESCAICIETFKINDVVRILPCRHQFHKVCIDQWLLAKRTCPMCKMDILFHFGLMEEGESIIDDESMIQSIAHEDNIVETVEVPGITIDQQNPRQANIIAI